MSGSSEKMVQHFKAMKMWCSEIKYNTMHQELMSLTQNLIQFNRIVCNMAWQDTVNATRQYDIYATPDSKVQDMVKHYTKKI